ncbi:ABC transporter substrate-binding protein [Pigmentiphaga sp. YJ18]|uniref:ABC transporter substrate-binding protein n=1 Tax=Pigmentiphaga sp. YJ18 TaxID=3134907 RepID=UPI0031142C25
MPITPDVRAAFAPNGVLRASINIGNPILASLDAGSDTPRGVSVDLARELARRLDLPIELKVFKSAGESVRAVTDEAADVGFFAIDPERGQGIGFTAPYVIIEGCYLVPHDSPLRDNDEVDAAGTTVVVGRGSAYDLFLTRALQHATLLRAPTSPSVVEVFVKEGADVAAGVRQQLEADMANREGLRLLPGRFMEIRQAMGLPKGRGDAAARVLRTYVEEAKASGFVAEALERHRIEGVSVAPAD